MTWLSRLLGKPRKPEVWTAVEHAASTPPDDPADLAAVAEPEHLTEHQADTELVFLSTALESEEEEDPDTLDEPDPTVGRYEPLDETVLGAEALADARLRAELRALSGPHRIGICDDAGPGSLAEALVRLESKGRVSSQVCDDPDGSPCILYVPN